MRTNGNFIESFSNHANNNLSVLIILTLSDPLVIASSSCPNLLVQDDRNTSGIIQSSERSTYSYNLNCHWNLSSNSMLELIFSVFNTEASADFLTVYDGDSPSSPMIGRFSGSSLPAPITSSSNKLHVRFTSDDKGQAFGFRARYRGISSQNNANVMTILMIDFVINTLRVAVLPPFMLKKTRLEGLTVVIHRNMFHSSSSPPPPQPLLFLASDDRGEKPPTPRKVFRQFFKKIFISTCCFH